MKYYPAGKIPTLPNAYLIYGDGGTGKTSLSKQFDGKKVLFSFDMSTNAIKDTEDTDVFLIEESDAPTIQQQVDALINKAIGSDNFDLIILDNITSLQNLVLENIDDASKDGRQNYQKLQLWFRQLGTKLKESGKTIYATAHQIDNGSNGIDGKGRFEPDMNMKTFNAFSSMFDVVGRIYLDGGKRLIDLDPENGNHAKNRLDERKLINTDELIVTNNNEKEEEK